MNALAGCVIYKSGTFIPFTPLAFPRFGCQFFSYQRFRFF